MTGPRSGHPDRQLGATETRFAIVCVGKLVFVVFKPLQGYLRKPMEGMHLGLFWGPVRGTPGPSGTANTMGGFALEPLGPYFEGFQK